MLYLSGAIRDDLPPDVAVMMTPMMGNQLPPGRTWAADTGCFAAPEKHDDDRYLAWLEVRLHVVERCLFATAPDMVGNAAATLARSMPMLPRIRALGYPAALVAQDGLEKLPVPWDAFDCLFIGGTTAWKMSQQAEALMCDARLRGKWVHAGRVNSYRRLVAMRQMGAHSADGTFIAFGPDVNIPRVEGWLRRLQMQPDLPGVSIWQGDTNV